MGRVARYKKIKSFDPYSRENGGRIQLDNVGVWGLGDSGRKPKKRSRISEKLRAQKKKRKKGPTQDDDGDLFDVPPTAGDDFDLNDLVGSLKKQKPVVLEADPGPLISSSSARVVTTVTESSKVENNDEVMEAKLLKIDKQLRKESPVVVEERKKGESKGAYNRRVKAETRQLISAQRQGMKNPEKKRRKKEFLNNKKRKKKKGKNVGNQHQSHFDGSDDDNDNFVSGDQAKRTSEVRDKPVRFDDQVERPPSFRQLPRGASAKETPKSSSRLTDETDILAEQKAMELIRKRALAQYAAVKQKRRREGDFHL